MGSEVIIYSSGGTDFFNRIAVVRAAGVGIKVSVAGNEINVSGSVRSQSSATLPDASSLSVGRVVVLQRLLRQIRCVVPQHPAVPRGDVTVRAESKVYDSIVEKQSWPLVFRQRVEGHIAPR